MKISVERSDLLRSMSRAQAIVERRTTIPILSNVLIEAREDRLTLRATDLDIELLDSIKAVVEKEGAGGKNFKCNRIVFLGCIFCSFFCDFKRGF